MTELTVGSLFSGIGGLDLGLERAGMRVVWQSEIDAYCSRVLAKHWPDVPNLGDVTLIDWAEAPSVDLICGGYPCQPFSVAGRQRGEADPRHLWPHMLDAVRVLRPRFALLENVSGHLALGFGRVLGDLAEIGYDCEWDCVPAAAVGAPHLRDRVFVVAHPQRDELWHEPGRRNGQGGPDPAVARDDGPQGPVADTDSERSQGRGVSAVEPSAVPDAGWRGPRIFGPAARPGGQWAVEPDVGRVAHGVPHRVDRLRGLGNAVVPQVAEHIGRLIVEVAA